MMRTQAIREPVRGVDPDAVHVALRALRYAQPLSNHPLLGLEAISVRLLEEDLADTVKAREWLLGRLLSEMVLERLGRVSWADASGGPQPVRATAEFELELLREAFATGSTDRQAWALLYCRFLGVSQIQLLEAERLLGVSRRSLARRSRRGITLLAEALAEVTLEDHAALARQPETPVHRRVIVAEDANGRVDHDARSALLETLQDDTRVARLRPEDARQLAHTPARDLQTYRLGRVAEWSQPRYRLDERFVALSMWLDQGAGAATGRWQEQERRFPSLAGVLATVEDPVLVLLGPPGSGKSTVLRHLELRLAAEGLAQAHAPVTFFLQLNRYPVHSRDDAPPDPRAWLADRWRRRFPELPPLERLLGDGRMILLLDALNEMPHRDAAQYRSRIRAWKDFLIELAMDQPGNRVVLSCRSLDYSAPLSSPALRVPQVRIEPLDDTRIQEVLRAYAPGQAQAIWQTLHDTPHLELMRTPYYLRLLAERTVAGDRLPAGAATLFTDFVRTALRREIARDNPLFQPGHALDAHDYRRVLSARRWRNSFELPEHGPLFPGLSRMAHRMQSSRASGGALRLRMGYDEALDHLGRARGPKLLAAAGDLGILDEDPDRDEVLFVHQLLQEYFAARALAREPDPALSATPWQASEAAPSLEPVDSDAPLSEPLPQAPASGWEEATILAAAMTRDPDAFVASLAPGNLALAGRCAVRPEVRSRLSEAVIAQLCHSLAVRSEDAAATLRHRIACAEALGALGDPRLESREGPEGAYLLPPLVEIPAGRYPIGIDEAIDHPAGRALGHTPTFEAELPAFRFGRYAVTNAEFRCFVAAGGYEDERWWDVDPARRWRRGETTNEGNKANNRWWHAQFKAQPERLEAWAQEGVLDEALAATWRHWITLDGQAFEDELDCAFPAGEIRAPRYFDHPRYNGPLQPVVGICCYEARAYSRWLAAQTGLPFRLPTEVEWEAAARGQQGRRYPWGDTFADHRCNSAVARIHTTSPIGVFREGHTPEGIADLCGNAFEWTSTAWGPEVGTPVYGYPPSADGRDDLERHPNWRRVIRGGAWYFDPVYCQAAFRYDFPPAGWADVPAIGMRLCVDGGWDDGLLGRRIPSPAEPYATGPP